jgi:hypothetical protein
LFSFLFLRWSPGIGFSQGGKEGLWTIRFFSAWVLGCLNFNLLPLHSYILWLSPSQTLWLCVPRLPELELFAVFILELSKCQTHLSASEYLDFQHLSQCSLSDMVHCNKTCSFEVGKGN